MAYVRDTVELNKHIVRFYDLSEQRTTNSQSFTFQGSDCVFNLLYSETPRNNIPSIQKSPRYQTRPVVLNPTSSYINNPYKLEFPLKQTLYLVLKEFSFEGCHYNYILHTCCTIKYPQTNSLSNCLHCKKLPLVQRIGGFRILLGI